MTAPSGSVATVRMAAVAAAALAGFVLTLWVFYPGVMTEDARYVYQYAREGRYGDWQSPVMSALWRVIDPLAPGSGSMFLLFAASYWLGFGLLALTLARASLPRAAALIVLALCPPTFLFVGMIWRDILFANVWLAAAALGFVAAGHRGAPRTALQAAAFAFAMLGVLLRPNALVAAPLLLTFVFWPERFSLKRTALAYLPAAIACFALIQAVYYGMLGATRQSPLQSVMVFDLGGISHFSGQNQFPGTWTPEQTAMITGGCYHPTAWDIYWTRPPCDFVMTRLEAEKMFGSPIIPAAWRRAVAQHPVAYLRHRLAFTVNFLAGANLTIWTEDIENSPSPVFPDRASFTALRAVNDALEATPVLRAGTWLLLCLGVTVAGWRRRDSAPGAFALGTAGSAVVYIATFLPLGVAGDFRYAYWAVLAGVTGAVVIWPMNWPDWRGRRRSAGAPPS
jgi:hypothetical protein